MFYFRASRAVNLNTSIHYQMVIIMLGAVDVAQPVEGLPTIRDDVEGAARAKALWKKHSYEFQEILIQVWELPMLRAVSGASGTGALPLELLMSCKSAPLSGTMCLASAQL